MPDTLKEFYNNDVTLTSLQAGVTLVSTTSTQTAVVKDIEMNNPNIRDIDFRVGGTTLISSNSSLTGSEIIGASSSMTMANSSQALLNRVYVFHTTASHRLNTTTTVFGAPTSTSVFTHTTPSFTTALSLSPSFACLTASGDFFYSGYNINILYKRTGGINGTQTALSTPGANCQLWAYDGSRYIYGYANDVGAMYEYDTQTNTWATRSFSIPINISYCSMTAIDRYVIINPDASSNVARLVNGATGASVSLGNNIGFSWVAVGCPLSVKKNSRGEYILVYSYYDNLSNTQLAYVNMGTSLATVTSGTLNRVDVDTGNNSFWATAATVSAYQKYSRDDTVTYYNPYIYLCGDGANNLTLFDVDRFRPIRQSTTAGTFSAPLVPAINATAANNDFGTVRIRATGVLSE